MVYYVLGGIYILVSLVFFIGWVVKKVKARKRLKEIKEVEEDDPFFDTFYPHF